jgi:Cd2+/Zn2+-exporting ATPase
MTSIHIPQRKDHMQSTDPHFRTFRVQGLDCAEEVAILKQVVGPLIGGEEFLSFDVLRGKMTVQSAYEISVKDIQATIARTGMRADLWQDEKTDAVKISYWESHRRTILAVVSGVLLLVGALVHAAIAGPATVFLGENEGAPVPVAAIFLYLASIIAGIWNVLPKTWSSIKRLSPDMNLLMVIAVIGAAAISQWLEAATVSFLFALSIALEAWSIGRARRAVAALLALTPPEVRIIGQDGKDELVPPEQVEVGTKFRVRPGDRIPLDGKVVEGAGSVDQSPITGESVPVTKESGDEVFAGTINGDGMLVAESTKPAGETTLARITKMVGDAQSRRAPSEQWVEQFARFYTPAVMVMAIIVLLIPPLLFGHLWYDSLYRALVLLVIACPCALVISTPVSIVAALACAARHGVLIKGGAYVEAPAHLQAIAMDKTGTLTQGRPAVVEIVPLNGHTENELLERATALETHSTHPLATAIISYAKQKGITIPTADNFRILSGKGAMGRVNGKEYWLGSHRYLEERKQETPEVHQRLEELSQAGHAIVVIGNDDHVCGFIALADQIRPESKQAVADLHRAGVSHLVMLSGDNQGTAQSIAKEVGMDEVHAELLPADKVTQVDQLVARYHHVAMIGDGVNDAPAMARANIGIAMGAIGTDAAIETADIALMSDDLSKIAWLIHHSRRTLGVIKQNITFALAVKAIFVILTFFGHASMWAAVAADSGATLLVVMNALRLLK